MSNSSISKIFVSGLPGPKGPQGPFGPCGNIGPIGRTGPTGPRGKYYLSYSLTDVEGTTFQRLNIEFSDGSTAYVYGSFRGVTFVDKTTGVVRGQNIGTGQEFLNSVNGGTFEFKGISAYGSLRLSYTGPDNSFISIDSIYWGDDKAGNYDPLSMSARELLFLETPVLVSGADIKHYPINDNNILLGLCGAFGFTYTDYVEDSVSDTSFHLNSGARVLNIGPIAKGVISGITSTTPLDDDNGTTLGVFLDTDAAGLFYLQTPIGIRGISGTFKKNEIQSITLVITSDNVWRFPENVFFEPSENYLSCGKNIIGLFTYDGGEKWIANVAHRGHDIISPSSECIPSFVFGSCCFTKANGSKGCSEYLTKEQCNAIFGDFYPASTCDISCAFDNSICCINGKCNSNISPVVCNQFGGQYWENVNCSNYRGPLNYFSQPITNPNFSNIGRFCYDPCSPYANDQAVCCKDGRCLGNYTKIQCEVFLGGKSVNTLDCSTADCCSTGLEQEGPCCVCGPSGVGQCIQTTAGNCKNNLNGIFMGPDKLCSEVSCSCLCKCGGLDAAGFTGACCLGTTCVAKTFKDCGLSGGDFYGIGVPCSCVDCDIRGITMGCGFLGACCVEDQCYNTSEFACASYNGVFQGVGTDCFDPNQNYCNSMCDNRFCPPNTNACFGSVNPPKWCRRPIPGCCCISGPDGRRIGVITAGEDCESISGGEHSGGAACGMVSSCRDSQCEDVTDPTCWEQTSPSPDCYDCDCIEYGQRGWVACNICQAIPYLCMTWCERLGILCGGDIITENTDNEENIDGDFLDLPSEGENNNDWPWL